MLSEDCDSLEVAPGVWVPVMSNTKAWRALPRLTMLYEASTILALVRGTTDPVIWMASLGPLNTLEDEWLKNNHLLRRKAMSEGVPAG